MNKNILFKAFLKEKHNEDNNYILRIIIIFIIARVITSFLQIRFEEFLKVFFGIFIALGVIKLFDYIHWLQEQYTKLQSKGKKI